MKVIASEAKQSPKDCFVIPSRGDYSIHLLRLNQELFCVFSDHRTQGRYHPINDSSQSP